MNKKSKEARLCVSKEINWKKEKHLIGIMRSVSLVLIFIFTSNCIVASFKPVELTALSNRSLSNNYPKYKVKIMKESVSYYYYQYYSNDNMDIIIDEKSPITLEINSQPNTSSILGMFFTIFLPIPVIPFYDGHKIDITITYENRKVVKHYEVYADSYLGITSILAIIPLFWLNPMNTSTLEKIKEFKQNTIPHEIRNEIAKIAPPDLAVYPDNPLYEPASAKSNTTATPTSGFTDTVVLKNGDFIENVKATVTIDSLIVTDANGKTTVYKKSQVLTVKKK